MEPKSAESKPAKDPDAQPIDLDHLEIYCQIAKHNGKNALFLRRIITDPNKMKEFFKRALDAEYIPARVKINNKTFAAVRAKALGLI